MDDIIKTDIYELLNISVDADEKEIKSAYRKKALTCHPDKNPDDPNAAQLFQQLTKALEILTDDKAKAAYDKVLKAKKAAVVRSRELDSKRKKLKEDLEAREKAAHDSADEVIAARNLQKEIERLRAEGAREVEAEKEFLRQQIINEKKSSCGLQTESEILRRLKVKWKIHRSDSDSFDYTEEELENILSKYGHITAIVVSKKKRGNALVEFSTAEAARSAMKAECGRPEKPFKLSWVGDQQKEKNSSWSQDANTSSVKTAVPPRVIDSSSTLTLRDYESVVLMKMRQAEERKRLIQEMMEEDNKDM